MISTMSTRKFPSPSPSTQKNKSILRKMLSSANRFLTGKKNTQKNQSPPPMTRAQEEEWLANNLQQKCNADLKKNLNSYEMMTPAQKKDLKSQFYTQPQLNQNKIDKEQNKKIQKITERLKKLGGKQNKTKRSNNSKNKKTKNKPKIIIK